MPRYKVLEKSFINNTVHEEGAIVEYDGIASDNLELITGKKAKADKTEDEVDTFSFDSKNEGK
ncbi:hypothetical protein [Polynucleobacter sp. UB-Piko-W3]|uniref:hypothetical protein n=1 Tax=Polynucleobacter sp. UB-Piko-W3 TaxID=1819735 RepID=UPI001C0D536F|nr:hypothetical protein [Polynucleobacter sp. UB-Piko-W3]MBU3554829.1 hypothetical protein [Polynucleobacter sp. UB-Piko-W3]